MLGLAALGDYPPLVEPPIAEPLAPGPEAVATLVPRADIATASAREDVATL